MVTKSPGPSVRSVITLKAALAAAATLVALAFALSTFERWLARRRRHELAWSISLALFALASAALWWGAAAGWNEASFRAFYLFGAILNVPWLALGTVYLLGGQRRGDVTAGVLAVLSGFAAGVMAVAPLHGDVTASELPQGSEHFDALPRILAAVSSGVAATVVIVGALWSAWRLVRGRPRPGQASAPSALPTRLVVGNLLIAAGTLVLAASGTLNARLGAMNAFSVTLLTGIVLLFSGFLVATTTPASDRRAARLSAASA